METEKKLVTKAAGAESVLNVGLGLIAKLREWADWSKSQAEDDLAILLDSAANEIERLRSALDDAIDERRTQYLTPDERAKYQQALNSVIRNALDNAHL